jgi:hypothetical protein
VEINVFQLEVKADVCVVVERKFINGMEKDSSVLNMDVNVKTFILLSRKVHGSYVAHVNIMLLIMIHHQDLINAQREIASAMVSLVHGFVIVDLRGHPINKV